MESRYLPHPPDRHAQLKGQGKGDCEPKNEEQS
jgi:hypothetical protein